MDRILVAVVSVSWLHFLFIPSPFHLETTDESQRIGKDLHAHVCMSARARTNPWSTRFAESRNERSFNQKEGAYSVS